MITPYLEQLIHEGKARYKSFPCGYGTLFTLPVREHTHIIITDFLLECFADYGETPKEDTVAKENALSHLIAFDANKSLTKYVLRSDMIVSGWYDYVGPPSGWVKSESICGHRKLDCYIVANSDVKIYLLRLPRLASMVFGTQALPVAANERANPQGCGTDVISHFARFVPGGVNSGEYYPNGARTGPLALATSFSMALDLFVNGETEILPATAPDEHSYPLLNVGYVEIVGDAPDTLKGNR